MTSWHHNPERRRWRGRSYRQGGRRVRELRDAQQCKADQRDTPVTRKQRVRVSEDDQRARTPTPAGQFAQFRNHEDRAARRRPRIFRKGER